MSETVRLSSAPPERISMDYAALREEGMELIRQWAPDTWTDHNAHDPGITLLEAFSYAITELGLRLRLDVADLLRSGERHRAAELEPAHRVLPAGPVTAADLRRLLLDHPLVSGAQVSLPADGEVPLYANAGATPPLSYTPGTPRVRLSGLYEVVVEFRERELNSNLYALSVTPDGQEQAYDLELALPCWDEEGAEPFCTGAAITSVAMQAVAGTEVWCRLPEAQSYFGKIAIDYTDAGGTARNVVPGVLLRIITELDRPADSIAVLAKARAALGSIGGTQPQIPFGDRVRRAMGAVQQLQRYLGGWRNLGEDAVRIVAARLQEIAICARLEVLGAIDLEQLLVEIFIAVDRELSPQVHFRSLAERRAAAAQVERIYDGPLLRHGFLDADVPAAACRSVLYSSDLLRLIMQHRRGDSGSDLVAQENPGGRDIIAVTDLTLGNFVNNRPITSGAQDCLHLVESERYWPRLSLAKSRIIFVRNDAEVHYDVARVAALFGQLRQEELAADLPADPSPVWPVAPGDLLPVEDYTPIQYELPGIYGVGESPLPDSSSLARRAAARQLQGYLLLFEQFLADATAQLGNINRFFSADPAQDASYFTRPLFELPGLAALLQCFPPGGDWQQFIADPANPFTQALRDAAESRERRLDRRNRMLDHLLARQGEETLALGQELHRWAQRELVAGKMTPAELADRLAARRTAANERLLYAKAALQRDAPDLNAYPLLANGKPLWRDSAILRIAGGATLGYGWTLVLGGQDRLRSVVTCESSVAATFAAEEALLWAGRSSAYSVEEAGGEWSYRLNDGTGSAIQPVAASPQTWSNEQEAQAAMTSAAHAFAELRLSSSLSPLARRIAHLTGIRSRDCRPLLVPLAAYFTLDAPAGGADSGATRWRFWELPGATGQVLLSGAFQSWEDSIPPVLRYGMDEWNYLVMVATQAGAPVFSFALQAPTGGNLALSGRSWDTLRETRQAIAQTIDRLYPEYSAEGFHLVEHLALRPRQAGEPLLSLPAGDGSSGPDPYSQRLSLVFPSGYARDFSRPGTAAETQPDRFRDPEFRRYAKRMVQQSCPAHLLPTLYWVDRQAPGSPESPKSFDCFEERYLAWLDTVLIPGAAPDAITRARSDLVESLDAIANDPS